MKNEKSELQKMIDRLRTRKAEFIKKKKEERRKQLIDAIGDVGVTPEYADIDLFTPETLTEIEISFNESIAACLEKIRQLDRASQIKRYEESPPIIEDLRLEVERLQNELKAAEHKYNMLNSEMKNFGNMLNAGADDRPITYTRKTAEAFDPRLANRKQAHVSHILSY